MTATKCEHGRRYVTLDREPRVAAYDDAFMDEGRFMVTLAKGFAFDDAAAPGADPEARLAAHSHGFSSVKEALARIRDAEPCHCGRCVA